MSVLKRALMDRELGGFPISISTSLAIESACGVHPEIEVSSPPIKQYRSLSVNVRTLVRNITGSVGSEVKKLLTADLIFPILIEEMTIIEETITQASEGLCNVTFFYPTYRSLNRRYYYANIKVPTTPLQIDYAKLETGIERLLGSEPYGVPVKFFDIDVSIPTVGANLLLSHYPIDLLNTKKGMDRRTDLIESHTGSIKNRLQFTTKLTGGKELERKIPFNDFTLQVFGDGVMFATQERRYKNAVLEQAEKFKWTMMTTYEKMLVNIKQIKDEEIKTHLLLLLK